MTVDEARQMLENMVKAGHGERPLQILLVDCGIPYAYDIYFEVAGPYDGERVWIHSTDEHQPEWLDKTSITNE